MYILFNYIDIDLFHDYFNKLFLDSKVSLFKNLNCQL